MIPKSPEEELIRAGHANELLDNVIFKEACELIESGLREQRRLVPIRETEMHTRLILTEQLWIKLKEYIQQTSMSGKLAAFTIQQREQLQWNGLKRA